MIIILYLFILCIMSGCWGFIWNSTIGQRIPGTWNKNIRKPIGECLICTSTWWCILVFVPVFLSIAEISWSWMLLFPIYGATSSSTALIINDITNRTILTKQYQQMLERQEVEALKTTLKPNN